MFRVRGGALVATALDWNVAQGWGVVSGDGSRHLLSGSAMATNVELLQFEVIRAIAASLISIAIVLLWLVVINQR
jgi:hypothetical protein